MKSIILQVSILAVAYCMPHNLNPLGNTKPSVEIEKQVVVELTSSTRIPPNSPKREEIDKTTREILAKIEQVNIKQGYVTKNSGTRTISELPHYYLYSYEQPKPVGKYVYNIPQTGAANSEKTSQLQEDDRVHDHHPKRKISQQQMYLIPVTNFASPQLIVTPLAELPKFYYDTQTAQNSNNDLRDVLERKTVDNIKDIVVKSQLPPNILSSTYFNPLVQNLPYYSPPIYNGYPTQNFPIIQNSPAVMLNSVTTIEEFDKTSCNSEKRIGKELIEENDDDNDDHQTNADIEVHLDNLIVTNFSATKSRTEKEVQEKSKQRPQKPILVFHHSQQNTDQYLKPELEDETEVVENEQDKTVETNDKKFFSKDNVGDGIFIRRLKVRKGGVAIAGPGGIATAGSGGTAIVGPNGWAYTHPDSLAIAGSGTKVIAVDPNIKLGDLIKRNVTKKGVLNTRIGKVVAIGPVIYYNRGLITPQPGRQHESHLKQLTPSLIFRTAPQYYQLFFPLKYPDIYLQNAKEELLIQPNLTNLHSDITINNFHKPKTPVISASVEEINLPKLRQESSSKVIVPYRNHPLFYYLKNGNTIQKGKVISFRREGLPENDTVTLILNPVAKAVAGQEGRAIANPVSRAILKQGTNVDILFEPEAVAIAGPGGIAHAESDLEISYEYS